MAYISMAAMYSNPGNLGSKDSPYHTGCSECDGKIKAPAARGRAEAPAFFCKSFRRERVLLENRDFAEIVM